MIKFPYAISDFQRVSIGGYFYVDRTDRIPILENVGDQLLFLRPRRFGKSMLLSMLENYYDLARADQFEQIFGHLAVGKNPTPLHNRYFVMVWDFSTVETSGTELDLKRSLYSHINGTIEQFKVRYQDLLSYNILIEPNDALRSFQSVLAAVQTTPYKLYLLIDEYDNFANEVLMSSLDTGRKRYEEIVKGEGFLKTVFKAIKSASRGQGLERVFITGVSPVVMSDISSGYNVATNIYMRPEFDDLCGFTEAEVRHTLRQISEQCHFSEEKQNELAEMMHQFYNGYLFTIHSTERLYNSTLALYFFANLQRTCTYPDEMLDDNLAMDRARIGYLAQLGGAEAIVLGALNEKEPLVATTLAQRFGVTDVMSPGKKGKEFLASLLYYFGVLTLAGRNDLNEYILRVPNLVIRQLYAERLRELLLPDVEDREDVQDRVRILLRTGNVQPLCDFVEHRLFAAFDNRDYLTANELTLKSLFLSLLFNDRLYIVDSETAIQRGYADLTLMLRPDLRSRQELRDFIFEFKFIKLSDVKSGKSPLDGATARQLSAEELHALPAIQEQLRQATNQLKNYHHALQVVYGEGLRLDTFAIVALGFERVVWKKV